MIPDTTPSEITDLSDYNERIPDDLWDQLSLREQAVINQARRGLPIKIIAVELSISDQTVKNYITSIYAKAHIHSMAGIVDILWRQGAFQTDESKTKSLRVILDVKARVVGNE